MALLAFRVTKRITRDGWEYAPPPGAHQSVGYNGSPMPLEWLWRKLGNDPRVSEEQRTIAMRKVGCKDARACKPYTYAGDIILVDDADPKLHPTDLDGRQHERISTMIELKHAWVPDAAINVSSLAGTRRMQRIMQGPPIPGELLPAS